MEAEVGERLETVKKNPGPRRGVVGKLRRIGGQGGKGGTIGEGSVGRGGERQGGLVGEGGRSVMGRAIIVIMLMAVVTWNLQRVSLREQNRGRLRRVAEWVEQRGWEVVLVTELFGEGEGVIWMGENGSRVPAGLDDERGGPGALPKGTGEPVEYV